MIRTSLPREAPCQNSLLLVESEVVYTEPRCSETQYLCTMRLFEMERLGLQNPDIPLYALATDILE